MVLTALGPRLAVIVISLLSEILGVISRVPVLHSPSLSVVLRTANSVIRDCVGRFSTLATRCAASKRSFELAKGRRFADRGLALREAPPRRLELLREGARALARSLEVLSLHQLLQWGT